MRNDYVPNVSFSYPDWVLPYILKATTGTSVPPEILLALLKQESGFNPKAVSPAGAQGIAQFMPGTAKEYGVNPWDPQSSIQGAVNYLQKYYNQYGDWARTLASYNAGPGNVGRYQQIPETRQYVKNIMAMSNLPSYGGNVQQTQRINSVYPEQRASSMRSIPSGNVLASSYSPSIAPRTYTVQKGDTLWDIANRVLGSGSKWQQLQGYSGDPRKLPIGTSLRY